MFKLMKERNELLRNKLNGVSIEEKKYEGNKKKLMNGMQKLNNKMKI